MKYKYLYLVIFFLKLTFSYVSRCQEALLRYTRGTKPDATGYSCWAVNATHQWYITIS